MQANPSRRRNRAKPKSVVAKAAVKSRRKRSRRNRKKKSVGISNQNPFNSNGQVSVASAYASGQYTKAPKIVATHDQIRVTHRELISSVSGSGQFTVASTFALNPGLASSFPWLSTVAQAWERYRFNSLKFEYYTRASSATPGSCMLVPDYDAADAAPATESVASSYSDVAEDAPWKDICSVLRPSALHALGPTKFVRTGALAANLDVKTYDAGNFYVCTLDGAVTNWGKLWVEYDITFFTPQLPPGGITVTSAQHIAGVTPTTASILGTATTQAGSVAFVTVSNSVVTFNLPGKYLINLIQVATTSVTQATAPNLVGGTYGNILLSTAPATTGSGTGDMASSAVINAQAGTTLSYTNTIVGGVSADLYVILLPPLIV